MNARHVAALAVIAAVAPPSMAQEDMAYTIEYAHSVLAPGQIQHISISATMTPGIGGVAIWNTHGGTGQTGTVYAFASTIFDIINILNGDTGTFSSAIVNPALISHAHGVAGPGGNWIGVEAGQIVFPPIIPGDQRNPIPLLEIAWTPLNYTARTVTFTTRLNHLILANQVHLQVGLPVPVGDDWADSHDEAGFNIVPAPPSVLPLTLAALGAIRRPRALTPVRQTASRTRKPA